MEWREKGKIRAPHEKKLDLPTEIERARAKEQWGNEKKVREERKVFVVVLPKREWRMERVGEENERVKGVYIGKGLPWFVEVEQKN